MECEVATFQIRDRQDAYLVTFHPDEIVIHRNGVEARRVANSCRMYKPCVTHCLDLIRLVMGRPAQSNQDSRRRDRVLAEARPLRVFAGE